jgi:hypothetical protein
VDEQPLLVYLITTGPTVIFDEILAETLPVA